MKHLKFTEGAHEYRLVDDAGILPDEIIPSVSQVISVINPYFDVRNEVLDAAAWRGTRVHKALEIYNTDGVQLSKEDLQANLDDVMGYVDAGIAFNKDHVQKVDATEKMYWSEIGGLKFAGTIDLEYIDNSDRRCIADYKTSKQLSKSNGIQGAGYLVLVDRPATFYIPKLLEDGEYVLYKLEDELTATEVFLGCLQHVYGVFDGNFGMFLKENFYDKKPLMRRYKDEF